MEIIPVIDLKDGAVVHARQGERASYRPIATPLAKTSKPLDVAAGLMGLHTFAKLYVADLDAIAGCQGHDEVIAGIVKAWPGLDIWVDRGAATPRDADARTTTLVIGSESQTGTETISRLKNDPAIVLSLDFRGDEFQGPAQLLHSPTLWPRRVIVMTLARVGGGQGPDLARLEDIRARAGDRHIYAAGGLRDLADGLALKRLGIAGMLTATALHDGRLTAEDIRRLAA